MFGGLFCLLACPIYPSHEITTTVIHPVADSSGRFSAEDEARLRAELEKGAHFAVPARQKSVDISLVAGQPGKVIWDEPLSGLRPRPKPGDRNLAVRQ
jgi:hypothetical protein